MRFNANNSFAKKAKAKSSSAESKDDKSMMIQNRRLESREDKVLYYYENCIHVETAMALTKANNELMARSNIRWFKISDFANKCLSVVWFF